MISANETSVKVNNARWERAIYVLQLILASSVFIIEAIDNTLLYVTRSQGYGPDTIISKLIRYLLLPTVIDYGLIAIGHLIVKKSKNVDVRKRVTMIVAVLISTNVAFTHYQFAGTLIIHIVPLVACILFEDVQLLSITFIASLCGQTIAIVARSIDEVYGKDIGPEAVVSYAFTISMYFISRVVISTLDKRKNDLKEALLLAERSAANEEKIKASSKILETLARTIDAKDKYTNGHSVRVAHYSVKLAEKIGFEAVKLEELKYQALLHDIGKIGVPDAVLNKPSKLTDYEFNIIKSHTIMGNAILKDMVILPEAQLVAKYHHERYDGKGYPSGLAGKDIPFNARIVCIADSYDAMSSDRIYRNALSKETIRKELVNGRGTQFDPELLDAFLEMFDLGELDAEFENVDLPNANISLKSVADEIKKVTEQFKEQENAEGKDLFEEFCNSLKLIGAEAGRSVEVIMFKLEQLDTESYYYEVDEAAEALKIAIKKNTRAADIHTIFSEFKQTIIFIDAEIDNIDVVAQRVLFDYYNQDSSREYRVKYVIGEKC